MAAENTDWLAGQIEYLSKLKAPTDTQKLLLSLAAKKVRDTKDERIFAVLVKSEKALQRAKKAQAEVSSLLSEEKRKAAREERAGRTHKLYQLGLLFSYAELDEAPREFLAGLLLAGAKMQEHERRGLTANGAQFLAEKESKKTAQTPALTKTPAPVLEPAHTRTTDTFLIIDFLDKDEVKNLGARWSGERRQWYVPAGQDLKPFIKWIKD